MITSCLGLMFFIHQTHPLLVPYLLNLCNEIYLKIPTRRTLFKFSTSLSDEFYLKNSTSLSDKLFLKNSTNLSEEFYLKNSASLSHEFYYKNTH